MLPAARFPSQNATRPCGRLWNFVEVVGCRSCVARSSSFHRRACGPDTIYHLTAANVACATHSIIDTMLPKICCQCFVATRGGCKKIFDAAQPLIPAMSRTPLAAAAARPQHTQRWLTAPPCTAYLLHQPFHTRRCVVMSNKRYPGMIDTHAECDCANYNLNFFGQPFFQHIFLFL